MVYSWEAGCIREGTKGQIKGNEGERAGREGGGAEGIMRMTGKHEGCVFNGDTKEI
jgi:hypothetical protein